jgi:hypothetical protein
MDAAEIDAQNAIDVDPHVVVAAEIEVGRARLVRELGMDLRGKVEVVGRPHAGVPSQTVQREEAVAVVAVHSVRMIVRDIQAPRDGDAIRSVIVPFVEGVAIRDRPPADAHWLVVAAEAALHQASDERDPTVRFAAAVNPAAVRTPRILLEVAIRGCECEGLVRRRQWRWRRRR